MYEANSRRKTKKPLWLFMFVAMSLIVAGFYGCQIFQQKPEQVSVDDTMPLDRRIGVLKSLGGVKTSNQGTHLLQLDDGNTILVKSLQINLDNPEYLGKTVELRGLLTYTTDRKQIMEVMNIDLVQQETSVAPETASWKDYSSTVLDFTIKYRDDLSLKDDGLKVFFLREPGQGQLTQETVTSDTGSAVKHQMTFTRSNIGDGETLLSQIGLKSEEATELLSAGLSKSKIGADNYDAYKKAVGNETIYYVDAGNYFYTVTMDCGSDETTLADQNLFYEMLGTLKIEGARVSQQTQETDIENNEDSSETQEGGETMEPSASDTQVIVPAPEQPEDTGGTQQTQEPNEGYTTMESESFKFAIQYPKSWYYSGSAGDEQGVIRHYEFGTKPLEEEPGSVALDLISGQMPPGSATTVGGKAVTVVTSGGNVELYVQGSGSRIYRITGPVSQKETLLVIAGSVQD